MFGRTGTGKSSLIEALTSGDGKTISPGRNDHTEDVREVSWGPMLVIDMPGTLGAGRELTRSQLEARAEKEVKLADLVILAFDTQNQLEDEFTRVAEMVARYRKPTVAVLNVRNPDWRSPDPTINARKRQHLDADVELTIEHIRGRLIASGISFFEIAAINTQRATFARCSSCLDIFIKTRDDAVLTYGEEGLLVASNICALEELLIDLVRDQCGDLRAAGLVGDLTKGAGEVARALSTDNEQIQPQEEGLDKLLGVLGYPQPKGLASVDAEVPPALVTELLKGAGLTPFEQTAIKAAAIKAGRADRGVLRAAVETSDGDELALLEELRGSKFAESTTGLAHEFLELSLAPLRLARLAARHRADNAVMSVGGKPSQPEPTIDFAHDVLKTDKLREIAQAAAMQTLDGVGKMLERTTAAVNINFKVQDARLTVEQGGRNELLFSHISRVGGITASGALVVAATNFWNPGGWAAAALAAAGYAISSLGSWLSKRAERKRLEARDASLAEGRKLVDDAFDTVEVAIKQAVWSTLTVLAAVKLIPLVRDLVNLRLAGDAGRAANLVGQGAPTSSHSGPTRSAADLRGSGWRPGSNGEPEPVKPPQASSYQFAELDWEPVDLVPDLSLSVIEQNLERLLRTMPSAERRKLREALRRIRSTRPKIVLCGDYSAGKSSLRAVLTRETRASRRTINRGAGPTTERLEHGSVGAFTLYDTPGLGSPNPDHASVAEQAIDSASLVIFLVTPRLIADLPHALLDRLARDDLCGTIERTRVRFALTRIDEMGVSPEYAPADFEQLVNQKRAELADVLTRRGLKTEDCEIIPLSPDPLASHFDESTLDACDAWSGVTRLKAELLEVTESARNDARRAASLAFVAADVTALRNQLEQERKQMAGEMKTLEKLASDAANSRSQVKAQIVSLSTVLETKLSGPLGDLVDSVVNNTGDKYDAAVKTAKNWQRNPRITNEIKQWEHLAKEKINDLVETIFSEFDRRLEAYVTPARELRELSALSDLQTGPGGLAKNAGKAGKAGRGAGNLAREVDAAEILMIRDALAKVGPTIKFKPWGATKLAKNIKVAGPYLAGIGVVIEGVLWRKDIVDKSKREAARKALREKLRQDLTQFAQSLMTGTDGAPGPEQALNKMLDVLRQLEGDLEGERAMLSVRDTEATATVNAIDDFLNAEV